MSPQLTHLFADTGKEILAATIELLKTWMSWAEQQADCHLIHVNQDYDAGDSDYPLAERRLLGIVKDYHLKEKDLHTWIVIDEETWGPKNLEVLAG